MKRQTQMEVISILFILLFIYAAISKLIDFDRFRIQLMQSPILTAFAGIAAWSVHLVEIIVAVLLCVPHWNGIGLYAAFSLMIAFTGYILVILNFSPFVPCSCGGILSALGWAEHLLFNVGFVLLALYGIYLSDRQQVSNDDHLAASGMKPSR